MMTTPGVNPDRVTITIVDGTTKVRLNRANKRTALDHEILSSVAAMGACVETMNAIRTVVLSGDGASFCTGLDVASFHMMADGGSTTGLQK